MMVVTDMEDVFVPAVDGFLVGIEEAASAIDTCVHLELLAKKDSAVVLVSYRRVQLL